MNIILTVRGIKLLTVSISLCWYNITR